VFSALPVAPFMQAYYTVAVATFAGLFGRYFMRTRWRYIPQSATTTVGCLIVAYVDDPAEVADKFDIKSDTTQLGSTTLYNMATMQTTPFYKGLVTPWGVSSNRDMRYISGPFLQNSTMSWTIVSASLRDQVQGAWLFTQQNAPTNTTFGNVFFLIIHWNCVSYL